MAPRRLGSSRHDRRRPGLALLPRYYFLLLPPLTLAASRGLSLIPRRGKMATSEANDRVLAVP